MTNSATGSNVPRGVWLRALLLVVAVAAGFVVLRWSPVAEMVSEERLLELIATIRGLWWAPPVLIVLYTVFTCFAVPVVPLIVAGAAFGPLHGFLYNMTGIFIGAAVSYCLALALGRDFVSHVAGRRLQRAERILRRHGFWPLVQTRFLPIPSTAVNFGAALAGVPPGMFLAASLVGLFPSTLIHSFFIAKMIETTGRDRLAYGVGYGLAFVFFNLLIGIPWFVSQRRRRRRYHALLDRRRQRAGGGTVETMDDEGLPMAFSYGNLFRFTVKWLRAPGWTLRRAAIVTAYGLFLPIILAAVWIGLAADRLLASGYRRRQVEAPVFIIGNFRSGTTFMHRLLAMDDRRFTTMAMWQILFAPSITHRTIVSWLVRLDRLVGRPGERLVAWIDRDWDRRNPMHQASLAQPEEDDYLLLHIWSALTVGLSSGVLDEAEPYVHFDQRLPRRDRRRIMNFYRRCVQRHLHVGPRGATYLAKNPALTPKVRSVLEEFPDARFVFMVRDPRETIPSFLSMMQMSWRIVGADPDDPALAEFLMRMAGHWYRYPPDALADLPPDQWATVVYDDLVRDPAGTVRQLYTRFGFEIDDEFDGVLDRETGRARSYRSRHRYAAQDLGLDAAEIARDFADIIERYGFDRTSDTPSKGVDEVRGAVPTG
jgi:uncharacterized membrane protein YdjX (TVP38/TMEM64 family)